MLNKKFLGFITKSAFFACITLSTITVPSEGDKVYSLNNPVALKDLAEKYPLVSGKKYSANLVEEAENTVDFIYLDEEEKTSEVYVKFLEETVKIDDQHIISMSDKTVVFAYNE